jgi:hypothetical protein
MNKNKTQEKKNQTNKEDIDMFTAMNKNSRVEKRQKLVSKAYRQAIGFI